MSRPEDMPPDEFWASLVVGETYYSACPFPSLAPSPVRTPVHGTVTVVDRCKRSITVEVHGGRP